MLENCRNARERWGGVSELIDRWLKERQELLVHYCELSALTDYSQTDMLREKFIRLCEVLVDYVSTGHFEIYDQLIREAREFNDGGEELAAKVYPRIQETRSEEHTSELQSRPHLVCRLLPGKKRPHDGGNGGARLRDPAVGGDVCARQHATRDRRAPGARAGRRDEAPGRARWPGTRCF